MRPFGEPISHDRFIEIRSEIAAIFKVLPIRRDVLGADYLMEPPDETVICIGEMGKKPGPRLRIGATEPGARPPFEWFFEVTSDITEAEYFKHYLVLESQIVLAHLKVLTPIDESEAEVLMHDLLAAKTILAAAE
jgi:hypothetical protein